MNVDELLTYKPSIVPKRPRYEEEERERVKAKGSSNLPPKKHKRIDMVPGILQVPLMEARKQDSSPDFPKGVPRLLGKESDGDKLNKIIKARKAAKESSQRNKNDLAIQQLLDQDTPSEVDMHSELTLKRMILLFEKRTLRNHEMRIKFPDNPEKFLESEMELFEIIKELHVLAAMPDLYSLFVDLNAVQSILELLSHENTDIAAAVINLLQELTDTDSNNENNQGIEDLVDNLISNDLFGLLVNNLDRMNESISEEYTCVHDTLSIFENIIDIRSDLIDTIGKQGLLHWILKRLHVRRMYDTNKAYAVEMLAILVHSSVSNRLLLGELNGIDVILQQLAYYKRYDPDSTEETEMMENLFDCLCSCLLDEVNRRRFLEGEGLQLMNLMLREKKYSRNGSLKALDHAMSGPFGADNCNKFVEILGLRTLFPLFMKTPKKSKKRTTSIEEHEEHVLSIIASLFRHCLVPQRQRLISKFIENDLEKVDRLMELHFKYSEKVDTVDAEVEKLRQAEKDVIPEDKLEEEMYLYRLDRGLYILQLIDYIILEISSSGPTPIKQRVVQTLTLRGGTLKSIRQVMREYAGMLITSDAGEWQMEQHYYILQLIDKF